MPNMSLKKHEMPAQDPNVRNKNFKEVILSILLNLQFQQTILLNCNL